MAPRKTPGIRRLKLEELLSKLEQIEQQARLTLQEYPQGLTLERLRLIVGLTKQMQSHLKEQVHQGSREPVKGGEAPRPRASDADERLPH